MYKFIFLICSLLLLTSATGSLADQAISDITLEPITIPLEAITIRNMGAEQLCLSGWISNCLK